MCVVNPLGRRPEVTALSPVCVFHQTVGDSGEHALLCWRIVFIEIGEERLKSIRFHRKLFLHLLGDNHVLLAGMQIEVVLVCQDADEQSNRIFRVQFIAVNEHTLAEVLVNRLDIMLCDMDVTLHVLSQVLNLGDDVLQIEVLVDDEHERIDFRIGRNLGHQRTVSELRTARSRRPVAGFVEVLVESIRVHYEALVLVTDETDVRKRLSGFLEPLQIIDHLHENTGYLSLSLEVHVILVLEDDFQLLRRSSLRIDEAVTLERMRNLRLERFLEVLVVHIINFPLFPASLHLFIELIAA